MLTDSLNVHQLQDKHFYRSTKLHSTISMPNSVAHNSTANKQVVTVMLTTGRTADAAQIDPSYSPGGANMHPI